MDTAKVFWTGRSQAVRLPKEYRLAVDEVRVRKHGNAVILEPIPDGWSWLDNIVGLVDEDFIAGVEEQEIASDKPELDFFK
ncbi:AbrB/MazE/SpoVT family DNA-binding domain-containing protein [Rhizobium sp. KVB221]|uniref:AbrB/MazE/SpoVT family DNA-binding domain-containing protein n=1 Tax=Rhizobium setariae TaxID=2801340 RepID=A0A936YU25_9HYPH|nr:type II toxin-antitoxin system VapB family antitoxin [Rhizobium setariae]MBL0374524.1 AbrB/MazE/SpoVT family DNA-binding domain-containing protein [Rhizobium setariae]